MEINRSIILLGVLIWTVLLSIIVYFNSKGKIHFGLGLGDVFISILIVVVILIVVAFTLFKFKGGIDDYLNIKGQIIYFLAFFFLVFIILKMTIFRGIESPWNGQIFF